MKDKTIGEWADLLADLAVKPQADDQVTVFDVARQYGVDAENARKRLERLRKLGKVTRAWVIPHGGGAKCYGYRLVRDAAKT